MMGLTLISFLVLLPIVQASALCKSDITGTSVTVSSEMAPNDKTKNYGADRSPINTTETVGANGITQMGAWVAEKNNFNQWIQIELKDTTLIRGLVTQGRNGCCKEWVTKYRVLYSEDCKNWTTVGGFNTTDAFFNANTDQDTPVTRMFHCPVMAKCIRINPLGWNKNIAMRVGLLGCDLNLNPSSTTSVASTSTVSATPSSTVVVTSQKSAQSTASSQQTSKTPQQNAAKTGISAILTTTTKPGPTQKTGVSGNCVNSCKGKKNGDYQSCTGCDVYVTCVWGRKYDKRQCPFYGTKWDDKVKRCMMRSTTCP